MVLKHHYCIYSIIITLCYCVVRSRDFFKKCKTWYCASMDLLRMRKLTVLTAETRDQRWIVQGMYRVWICIIILA